MAQAFVDLDVRPTLRNGGEPFQEIMQAIASLAPDQGLRLYATFKPVPLFQVLGNQGFTHEAREIENGDWEVMFHRGKAVHEAEAEATAEAADTDRWPEPARQMDNRDLEPPEPMVRILATTETMRQGEVLEALLCREPMFLFPELAKRGHTWRGAFEPDGTTYKIHVRIGESKIPA